MRLHWKKGPMMNKGGHHHLKRKHMLLRSMLNEDDFLCKKKHFKRMMKGRPGFLGKWKHFKAMRSHTSSDSDDSDHHHGKGKHFKRMMKGRFMLAPELHGKWKHFKSMRGHSSSDSDDSHHHRGKGKHFRGSSSDSDDRGHHHGKGKHFKGIRGWCMSDSDDGHHGKGSTERNHHHGKEKHFKEMQGRPGDEGMQRRCMSDDEGGRRHRGMHFMGRRGGPMNNLEGHHGTEKHSKGIQGMSCPDDEEMQGHCMSDNERRHHGRMHFMGRQERPMTDHHGHHGNGKHMHMRGMTHHHKGKHWMKRHEYRRGFFDDDSGLVPICTPEAEGCAETLESENTGNQATETAEVVVEGTTRTKNQETQTSGIMEIVIEDQEAMTAAIRIVNKFL